ncbi:hypothetical protein BDV29DRAFT_163796 [Aspergillus leporis]|uniref:DUF676 domain-containing protein n=1 Tax=Aspergillus leporis TaxID=41062 RepID=A0A5N5WHS0_9EURO|nr:hypothetical protein BDV29DRAFT_163796 [Aspergillus leporis]
MSDFGLKTLWPETASDTSIEADIVFVHGLRGGRETTWKKKKWSTLWPRDVLPKDINHARILTWGYDANIVDFFKPAGQTSIFGHALQLLSDLANQRRKEEEKNRPIIFLAHSLGGLVVKDALYQSHSEGIQPVVHNPRLARIKTCTIGVIFAGTPHRGADKAKWATIAGHLTRFVLKSPNTRLTEALERGAHTLERLQGDFSRILLGLPIYTFSEEREFPGNGIIVDRDSAVIGFPHEVRQQIPADHKMMVKFAGPEDPGYERIKNAILNLIEDWKENTEARQTPTLDVVREHRVNRLDNRSWSGTVAAESSLQGDVVSGRDINFGLRPR